MSIDTTVNLPNEDAVKGIATSMGLPEGDVLVGLQELSSRGFLKAKCVQFPGVLPVWMLFAL